MIARIAIPLSLYLAVVMSLCLSLWRGAQTVSPETGDQAMALLAETPALREHSVVGRALAALAPKLSPAERRALERAINRYCAEHGHDPLLLLAVINTESGFQPGAVSPKGAVGLMQVRPFVARALAAELNLNPETVAVKLRDPEFNVMIGSYYLAQMKRRFRDLPLALEAYNLGPTRLREILNLGERPSMGYSRRVMRWHGALMAKAEAV